MLNKIYIHYITTLFVLESFIISCWLLKGKKKSVSELASLLEKNRYRNRPRKIMIGASLHFTAAFLRYGTLFDLEGYKHPVSNKYTK